MLHEIFVHVFDDDSVVVQDDTTAHDIDEWDSLSHITLIVAIESRFGFKFKASELESLKNVGEMIDIIALKAPEERITV